MALRWTSGQLESSPTSCCVVSRRFEGELSSKVTWDWRHGQLCRSCCGFISLFLRGYRSSDDQEVLFDQILMGQLEFPLPYWDNVSETAKVSVASPFLPTCSTEAAEADRCPLASRRI